MEQLINFDASKVTMQVDKPICYSSSYTDGDKKNIEWNIFDTIDSTDYPSIQYDWDWERYKYVPPYSQPWTIPQVPYNPSPYPIISPYPKKIKGTIKINIKKFEELFEIQPEDKLDIQKEVVREKAKDIQTRKDKIGKAVERLGNLLIDDEED